MTGVSTEAVRYCLTCCARVLYIGSEGEGYEEAHAPLGTGIQVVVTESAHILNMEELEDVVDA